MTLEQKANAYDKALERMKSWARGEHPECFTEAQKTTEFIFPELKESKSERIMKVIRGWIYSRPASFFDNGISKEEILAWLEKQGEQKPVDSYCQENCKGFQETGKCFADGDCKTKREAESTDKVEQSSINEIEIPFGAKDSELQEATYYIPDGFYAEIDDDKVVIKKGEKPAEWSEDDERIKKCLINLVNEIYNNTNYITFLEHKELLAWLEKLDDNIEL